MKIKYLPFIAVILINGCSFKTKESTIMGTWRLYDIEELRNESKVDDPFSKSANLKSIVKDGSVICFFEDGRYTEIKGTGAFKSGTWKYSEDNRSVSFIDSGHVIDQVEIKIENSSTNKQLLTLYTEKRKIKLIFIKESESLTDSKNDPFYASNNRWRVRPAQPESSDQLTNRLANYFKHLALILKSAKERKQNIVSFEFSQGPVKIYNGGIGILPYNTVSLNWINCFYDEADAHKAYIKYEDYLRTSSYKGAGIGNWIEDDYNILLSIYAGISESISKNN